VITKLLVGTAVAAAAALGAAAPAGADPSSYPSPFNVLSCDGCLQTVKKGGPSVMDQMNLGLQAALPDSPGPNPR
jgi:hypothetical protein